MVIGIDASRAFVGERTGTENYSYLVIKHILRLPEAKLHKFVLFTRPKSIIPDWVRENNVIVRQIKLRYLWTQVGLAWATWGVELDVLWVPAHTLPVLRRHGLRTVVTIHGLEYRWLPEYRNWLQRWYLPISTYYAGWSADQLIAVSQSTKNDLLREIKTDPNKIKVIHEGVEVKSEIRDTQLEKEWGRYGLRKGMYVLFVGTLQPRKNLVALIEAFAHATADLPGYRLVIAGSVGWMAEPVLQTPARLGMSDRVVFTGRVDSLVLSALYQGASVYVQPSWTEGFGLPVLEAMASGVPVVGSSGGALPEVVGDAGVVVQLDDSFIENLATAIKRGLTEIHQRKSLINRGHQRVQQFSWDRAAKETLLLLSGEDYK